MTNGIEDMVKRKYKTLVCTMPVDTYQTTSTKITQAPTWNKYTWHSLAHVHQFSYPEKTRGTPRLRLSISVQTALAVALSAALTVEMCAYQQHQCTVEKHSIYLQQRCGHKASCTKLGRSVLSWSARWVISQGALQCMHTGHAWILTCHAKPLFCW